MKNKRKDEDRSPTAADAYAPPGGPRSTKVMLAVAAIVAVCVVVFFLVIAVGGGR